jgi:hypothetical protein
MSRKDEAYHEGMMVDNSYGMVIPVGDDETIEENPREGTWLADRRRGLGRLFINGRWIYVGKEELPYLKPFDVPTALTGPCWAGIDTSKQEIVVELALDPLEGDTHIFFDSSRSWHKNKAVLVSAHLIGGQERVNLTRKGGAIELRFKGGTWQIISASHGTSLLDFDEKVNIDRDARIEGRKIYALTEKRNYLLTLDPEMKDGDAVTVIDAVGTAKDFSVKIESLTETIEASERFYELVRAFGSVTIICSVVNGQRLFFVVYANNSIDVSVKENKEIPVPSKIVDKVVYVNEQDALIEIVIDNNLRLESAVLADESITRFKIKTHTTVEKKKLIPPSDWYRDSSSPNLKSDLGHFNIIDVEVINGEFYWTTKFYRHKG